MPTRRRVVVHGRTAVDEPELRSAPRSLRREAPTKDRIPSTRNCGDNWARLLPEAKRLWSEMTWVFYLIVRNVKPKTKRDRIARVWEWSGAQLPEDHWALDDDVLTGCANSGAGRAHQWRELRFVVLVMLDWFSRSVQEHEALATDPWKFAGWLADRRLVQGRQFRHALLFLLFPDSFEPILVGSQKRSDRPGLRPVLGRGAAGRRAMTSPSTGGCWTTRTTAPGGARG